jgi:hypothetical protein
MGKTDSQSKGKESVTLDRITYRPFSCRRSCLPLGVLRPVRNPLVIPCPSPKSKIITMISMILLELHAVQALNEPRVQPEEAKPESMRPARPGVKKVEKEIAIVNCFGLHLRHAAR